MHHADSAGQSRGTAVHSTFGLLLCYGVPPIPPRSHVHAGVGAGVVSTSRSDMVADDRWYEELDRESSGEESPRRRWSEAKKRRVVACSMTLHPTIGPPSVRGWNVWPLARVTECRERELVRSGALDPDEAGEKLKITTSEPELESAAEWARECMGQTTSARDDKAR